LRWQLHFSGEADGHVARPRNREFLHFRSDASLFNHITEYSTLCGF
jgi:hypothetical protein